MLKSVCKMALLHKGIIAIPKTRLQSDENLFRNLIIVNENLQSPEVKSKFAGLMAEPAPSSPQAFGEFMTRERAKYERVVKLSGAKVD